MKKQIKLIATDFDGTVLRSGSVTNPNDVEMFEEVQKRGYKAMGVTGQAYFTAVKTAKKFGFDKYFDIIASDNGAYIAKISEHEVYRSLEIEHEVIMQLYEVLKKEEGSPFFCWTSDEKVIYVDNDEDEKVLRDYEWFKEGYTWKRIPDITKNITIHQATLVCKAEAEYAVNEILEAHKESIEWSFDENDGNLFYSINNIKASKASALEFIAEKFNITLDEILIFGDGPNDLPMFRIIKHSVAPANAVDDIKEIAMHQTDSVSDGGVGNFLKKHFIGEE